MNQIVMQLDFAESAATQSSFLDEVLGGLSAADRRLPCKYFYDERGATLFDKICQLQEYYLTRVELQIMQRFAPKLAWQLGPRVMLIEFGSGSGAKSRLLLDNLKDPVAYVPVDVSWEQLRENSRKLSAEYPDVEIRPMCADFTQLADLPVPRRDARRRVVYFPGSTIGNFSPPQAQRLLSRIARCCGRGGGAVIGIDLKKDPRVIEAAYNDEQGVTDQFNLNLLRRINRELDANFRLDRFHHEAHYNFVLGRVEIYLVSDCHQTVSVAGRHFEFAPGERICTEHSYKYTLSEFAEIAAAAGLFVFDYWTDPQSYFAVLQFEACG